jgi:hypothetical protein
MGNGDHRLSRPVRALGWVHAVVGGLGSGIGVLFLSQLTKDSGYEQLASWLAPLIFMAMAIWFLPSLAGGWGVLAGARWARPVLWLQAPLLLLLFPVGTVLGGFTIWALLRSREHVDAAAENARWEIGTRTWLKRRVGAILALLAAIGLLGAMIGLGYLFRDQLEHAPSMGGLAKPIAFGVGLLIAAGFVLFGQRRRLPPLTPGQLRQRQQLKADREAVAAAHAKRLAAMEADPDLRAYAARIRAGEAWSDDQIAYDRDRTQTRTCAHLAPVERAMREAGLFVRLLLDRHVRAQCRIDEPALRSAMPLDASVTYSETIELGGRAYEDPPGAALLCNACRSSISVLAPWQWREETATFPGQT